MLIKSLVKKIFFKLRLDKFPITRFILIKYILRKQKKLIKKNVNLIKNLSKIKNGKKITLFYDCKISPSTFGDFFHFIMLARFFRASESKVELYLISDQFRESWYSQYDNKFRESKEIINVKKKYLKLISKSFINLHLNEIDFHSINFNSKKLEESVYNLEEVKNREPSYKNNFNYLNELFFLLDENQKKEFFLSKRELKNTKFTFNKFITLACRFNPFKKGSLKRNMLDYEFIQIVMELKKKFQNHQIIIISDKVGTEYFKIISKNNNLKLFFSYDFREGVDTDLQIILRSKYYITYKGGGGISATLPYTKIPYLIHTEAFTNEIFWKKKMLTSWEQSNQKVVEDQTLQKFKYEIQKIQI